MNILANGPECYVYEQQEGIDDKCIKIALMCQRHEKTYASLILWATPHEW